MKKKKAAKRKAKKVQTEPPEAVPEIEPVEPHHKPTLRLSALQAGGPQGNASGIRCSKCGCGHWRVIYTRERPASIMRRRECRNCKKRITTHEQTS